MKNVYSIFLVCAAAIAFYGCSTKAKPQMVREEAKAPEVTSDKPLTEVKQEPAPVEAAKKEQQVQEVKPETKTPPPPPPALEKSKEMSQAEIRAKIKQEFRFEDIHFDFDKYDLKENERNVLNTLGEWLQKNTQVRIAIEGHCDERGSNEYNLALGDRRANSVKDYLTALGVKENRISAFSYGEEKPLCNESNEDCWWKNRRAHFILED